ncbi:MAG TPA: addiction module protein [Planctomycetia bacterium]|nr:addiction module protein [Planctomycetia bacterium]
MPYDPPLETMTIAEKLDLLEAVWDSLCSNPAEIPSPEWHADVLARRRERLDSGASQVSDWSDAKRRLQDLGR